MYLLINFCIILLIIYIVLNLIFKNKTIYWNGYKIKIYKHYEITNNLINEIKIISLNSVNTIPNNPIFYGKNKNNKQLLIIYKKNKPIAFNIMFDYKYDVYDCLHIGLTLIDKKYQGKSIKNLTIFNIIYYLIENYNKNIYISNLGRASTSFKLFNQIIDNSFPNYINNNINNDIYKSIFVYFFNNFKEDTQISKNATYNIEKFIIYDGNDCNGGSEYLITNKNKQFVVSKNKMYNQIFYDNLREYDDLFCIGKVNIFIIFIYIKKILF